MEELERREASCRLPQGEEVQLVYTLLETPERKTGRRQYGIRIRMRRSQAEESCQAVDVTSRRTRGAELVALLQRNLVTPALLREILEEIL